MELFRHSAKRRGTFAPLAERLRPGRLEAVLGQAHLLGDGKLLDRILKSRALPSMIFWGPPGSGKTTLARLLARHIGAELEALSAVMAGVKDVRQVIDRARDRRDVYGERTVLFLDEIHRFSKSQQDALLPHVESGVVTLIGATTENPSFQVNAALLSRSRVLRLEALESGALATLIDRALGDSERGLGQLEISIDEDAREQLIERSAGDARRLLNALELAAEITRTSGRSAIDADAVAEAMQQKTLLYDKSGEEHYGVVSAFIKSMRGSDPDAAVYWMTRMLEAGEDPLFILRRMVIFASEDIGVADVTALQVAIGALHSFRFVGLPEGVLPMTQAAIYLACAPKSNTALTSYAAARRLVREHGSLPVPPALRNASTSLQAEMGYGRGYKYPHNFDGNYVAAEYLPEELRGQSIYQPSSSGDESEMAARLEALRDAASDDEG